jgi:Multicopper oxidase
MLSRRGFLAGTIAAGATSRLRAQSSASAPTVLRLERCDIDVNGKSASVLCIRQPDGTIGITTDVGKPFRVRVENHIDEPSLIHWHGLTPPWQQDGVPAFPRPQYRQGAAPTMISRFALAAPIGCTRITDFRSSFCCRRRAHRFQLHYPGEDICGAPVTPT